MLLPFNYTVTYKNIPVNSIDMLGVRSLIVPSAWLAFCNTSHRDYMAGMYAERKAFIAPNGHREE
jgi:hypothetical protein